MATRPDGYVFLDGAGTIGSMTADPAGLSPLLLKLGRLSDLTEDDVDALRSLPHRVRSVPAGRHLVREGDSTTECYLLLDGYACRHKLIANGTRQILSFHIRGDLVDLQHVLVPTADHNVQMVTAGSVAEIAHSDLLRLAHGRPRIADALWRDTLIDGSVFREWVLNVGRRGSRARVAHMLCEFAARFEAAGLGAAESFEFPLTQVDIADATALTSVHVNRMLRELRADGALAAERGKLRIADWDRLAEAAGFSAAYLHAAAPARSGAPA